jgi:hypothetical protein
MRRFPPLRPEVLALLAATMASPAWAGDPASAAKGAAQTEPAKPGAPQRFLGDKSSIAIQGGDLVIHDSSTLTMLRLHPIAAAVFLLADGQKPLAAIRSEAETSTGLPVDEATLFAVLDALADAKLLSARVTPPGSGDLSSFVLSDGTLGSALVEAGAAQPEAKLKLPACTSRRKRTRPSSWVARPRPRTWPEKSSKRCKNAGAIARRKQRSFGRLPVRRHPTRP